MMNGQPGTPRTALFLDEFNASSRETRNALWNIARDLEINDALRMPDRPLAAVAPEPEPLTLEKLCAKYNIRAEFRLGEAKRESDWEIPNSNWRVTLRFRRRLYSLDYFTGDLVTDPSASDVLYCLLMDASYLDDGYEAFANECFSADDQRKARETWRRMQRSTYRLKKLLGEHYDEFAQAALNY